MKYYSVLVLFSIIILGSCQDTKDYSYDLTNESKYIKERMAFKTKLNQQIPAPQDFPELVDSEEAKVIEYKSSGRSLKALLVEKNIDKKEKHPVLVYLHGGFALDNEDIKSCKTFTDKGYIVFAPSFRGENGNPGYHELFMGEVDDAIAAINWIADQTYVDKDRIYVFGHSVGSAISLELSLFRNLPIKISGGNSGIYERNNYKFWDSKDQSVPFDLTNEEELRFREPLYQISTLMSRDHYLFVGLEDGFQTLNKNIQPHKSPRLKVLPVKGDHFDSLVPSIREFARIISVNK